MKTCPQAPTFPWEARPSDLRSSQSGLGMPSVLTRTPLVRVTPQIEPAGGCGGGADGGAVWPGWVAAETGCHLGRHPRPRGHPVMEPSKSLSRGSHWRVWWAPGSFSIQCPQRSCEAVPRLGWCLWRLGWCLWRPRWCLQRHIHWPAGARGTDTISSRSSGRCHMPPPPGLNSGFPLKLNSCHPGAPGSFANVA